MPASRIALVTSNSEANARAMLGPANVARFDWLECGASCSARRRAIAGCSAAAMSSLMRRSRSATRRAISPPRARPGVTAAAVLWGYAHREALANARPDLCFEHPDEVARLLLGEVHADSDERRQA